MLELATQAGFGEFARAALSADNAPERPTILSSLILEKERRFCGTLESHSPEPNPPEVL